MGSYSCTIQVLQPGKLAHGTVGHMAKEISRRHVDYLIYDGGSVSGYVASVTHRQSPIPAGGLEIPLMLTFRHSNLVILV